MVLFCAGVTNGDWRIRFFSQAIFTPTPSPSRHTLIGILTIYRRTYKANKFLIIG